MKKSARVASSLAILLLCVTLEHPEAFDPPVPLPSAKPQPKLDVMMDAQVPWVMEEEGVIMDDYGYMIGAESAIEPMHMAPSGYLTAQYDSRFALLAPVPEPETYAMMLTGAALLGFRLRRKTQSS
jgi:hypothetical protein